MLAITAAAVIGRRSYPYFFVGWFWYVGMLVPVLGLTFVGVHARADRYTYLSQIGLYIALVWGAMRLGASWPARRWVFGIGSALMLAALMACSWRQTGYWQDDKTLWEHALACDPKNVTAHLNLGAALERTTSAAPRRNTGRPWNWVQTSGNLHPVPGNGTIGLGNIADRKGDNAEAMAHYEQALESDPGFVPAQLNLGVSWPRNGNFDEAAVHFHRASSWGPTTRPPIATSPWCWLQGKTDEAIANCRKALKIDPNFDLAHSGLAVLLAERGDVDEAIVHFRRAIEIDPDLAFPYSQMAQLLRKQGKMNEAAKFDERGQKPVRRYAETQNLRGTELAQQGKVDEAIAQFEIAIAALPDYAQAHNNLADALALQGNRDGAPRITAERWK